MAIVAGIATGNMRGRFAHGGCAVVAAGAGTEHVGMVHTRHRHPAGSAMAIYTEIGRLYMQRILAGRCHTVVATRTVGRGIAMIEDGTRPSGGVMAIITGVTAGNMRGRFTHGGCAVVAAETGAEHFVVIGTGDGCPGSRAVTTVAQIRRLNVRGVFAGRCRAIVAAGTGAKHIGMTDTGDRYPGGCTVTALAGIGGLNMRGRLARCSASIVTAGAVTGDIGVIERR